MTFDSLDFLIFFAVVLTASISISSQKHQLRNSLLLMASYFFYGAWSLPFLGLLFLSTLVDFFVARAICATELVRARKQLLAISIAVNLTILGFFKYFNFFIDSALMLLPLDSGFAPALEVILPVGISFYTFQTMSYTIDVYRRNIKASTSLLDFALYVAFFPQLVAGPIERAANMLPQFARTSRMTSERMLDGIDLCVRGYFKKIVVADNIAPLVNFVFADVDGASGASLWIASYAFAIQIYADFSAYTDIARGTSKLLGFELMINFNSPYRSLNVGEFWKRWHISLSTWFRDYLYIPLGGSRGSSAHIVLRNILIVFLLSGLWHGAAWNFVLWGFFHGVLLSAYILMKPLLITFTSKAGLIANRLFKFASWFVTFHLVILSWVLFRAESAADIGTALTKMLLNPVSDVMDSGLNFIPNAGTGEQLFYIILIAGSLLSQFTVLGNSFRWSNNPAFRGARAAASLALILILFPTIKEQFIYFQF